MPSALVTKLRKQPEVRDAEALAAWIGRYKKLRKAGVSNKRAMKLAGKEGGMREGGVKAKDRKTGGGDKKDAVDKEVQDKIWERKNPENFNKPYLDKRTQEALREDPEKIDELIEQKRQKLRRLESGRGRNLPDAAKERERKEAKETIRALKAFRRFLETDRKTGGGGKKDAVDKPQAKDTKKQKLPWYGNHEVEIPADHEPIAVISGGKVNPSSVGKRPDKVLSIPEDAFKESDMKAVLKAIHKSLKAQGFDDEYIMEKVFMNDKAAENIEKLAKGKGDFMDAFDELEEELGL